MNYFQELLESYDRLKKRTFKLVYINEAVALPPEGVSQANDYITRALNSPEEKLQVAGLNLQVYFSNDKQEVMMAGDGVGAYPKAITQNKQPAQGVQGQRGQNYSQFVRMVSGQGPQAQQGSQEGQQPSQEQIQTPEQAYQEAITPGSKEYLLPLEKPIEPELQRELFFRAYELKKLCKPLEKDGSIPDFCDELQLTGKSLPGTLGIGSSQKSFEKKVSQGTSFVRNADTGLIERTDSLSLDQRRKAVDGWKDLTQVLVNPELVDCNKAFNNIRIKERGGRSTKIVFGSTDEGLDKSVVTTAGVLELTAISKLKQHCKKSFKPVDLTLSVGNKYTVRGTFFEKCTNFAFRFKSVQKLQDRCASGDKKACSIAQTRRRNLAEDIVLHTEKVRSNAITTQQSEGIVTTPEYAAIMDLLKEHQSFDTPAILEFLSRENAFASVLVNTNFPNALGVIDSSLNPKTGNRADRKVLYLDEQSALADMSKLGGSVTPVVIGEYLSNCATDDSNPVCSELSDIMEDYKLKESSVIYLGDLGLKRVTSLEGGLTAGSFSGAKRLNDLSKRVPLKKIQNGDRIEDNYISKIDEIQQITPGDQRDRSMRDVEDKIDNTLSNFTSQLSAKIINVPGQDGQKALVDLNKPTKVVEYLRKVLREKVSNDILKNSSLDKLLNSDNYRGRESREESVGTLMRYIRNHMYRKSLQESPEATTDALLRRLYICAGNNTELIQSMVDDSGKNLTFNHNQVLRNLEQAKKDKRLRVEVKDSLIRYYVSDAQGNEIKYAELGEDVNITYNGESTHKFSAEFTTDAARSAVIINEEKKNSEIDKEKLIEEFIKIQQKLLECFNSK